jgi:hypothetical protein
VSFFPQRNDHWDCDHLGPELSAQADIVAGLLGLHQRRIDKMFRQKPDLHFMRA